MSWGDGRGMAGGMRDEHVARSRRLVGALKLIALLALLGALLAPAAARAAEPTKGKIAGRVTSAGMPLQGVLVCALTQEGLLGTCSSELTDTSGEYTIENVEPGTYFVEFSTPIGSFITQFYNGQSLVANAQPVTVKAGETTAEINAEMQEGAQITGTLTDAATEQPLVDAKVCAIGEVMECVLTDGAGDYSIMRLPAGTYLVRFSSEEHVQYYPNVRNPEKATLLTLGLGQHASEIDDELGAAGQLSGTVTNRETKQPVAELSVCATPTGEPAPEDCVKTGEHGEYTIGGLPSGGYEVVFSSEFTESTTEQATIVVGQTTALDAEVIDLGMIRGTIRHAESGLPVVNSFACAGHDVAEKFEPLRCGLTNEKGEYTIEDLPDGSYVVGFDSLEEALPENERHYLPTFYQGQSSVMTAQEVSASAGTVVSGIDGEVSALQPLLTVREAGTGAGSVESETFGISCHESCSEVFPVGEKLALAATPAEGSTFVGWSGGGCSGTGKCEVTLDASVEVTATFTANPPPPPPPATLTVKRAGTGSGSVASTPAGVECGTTCSAEFPSGAKVSLAATAAEGSTFAGWQGACTGTGPCEVTAEGSVEVTATFTANEAMPPPVEKENGSGGTGEAEVELTIYSAGGGTGTITSAPAGIECGSTCTARFPVGTHVILTATSTGTSTFFGWVGADAYCEIFSRTCEVVLEENTTIQAFFLNGTPGGEGGGEGGGGAEEGGSQTGGGLTPPAGGSVDVGPSGALTLKVGCLGHETSCSGTMTLTARVRGMTRLLGKGTFKVTNGKIRSVTIHLNARGRKLLKAEHVLRVTVTIVLHSPGAAPQTSHTQITLREKAKKH